MEQQSALPTVSPSTVPVQNVESEVWKGSLETKALAPKVKVMWGGTEPESGTKSWEKHLHILLVARLLVAAELPIRRLGVLAVELVLSRGCGHWLCQA
jgi:hypothetical protein